MTVLKRMNTEAKSWFLITINLLGQWGIEKGHVGKFWVFLLSAYRWQQIVL
jgi:hypothetical protein